MGSLLPISSLLVLQVLEKYVLNNRELLSHYLSLQSAFINSVISSIGDSVRSLCTTGATRDKVTPKLEQFSLNQLPGFEDLQFTLYDILFFVYFLISIIGLF